MKIVDSNNKANKNEKIEPKSKSLMEHFNLHSTILDDKRSTFLDAKLLQKTVTSKA